ncbi:MAG: hypothetical protein ACXWC3_26890, partial [Burkholderiales bacterium]
HTASRPECGCHALRTPDFPAQEQLAVTADVFRVMVSLQNRDKLPTFSIQTVDDRIHISMIHYCGARCVVHRSNAIITECADRNDFKGAHAYRQT